MIAWYRFVYAGLFCLPLIVAGQSPLTFSTENNRKGVSLYVSNTAYCPISMSLDLDMDNTVFDYDKQPFFVVPARARHFKLGDIRIYDPRQAWHYSYKVKQFCSGDLRLTGYDSLYEYALPWQKDLSFPVIQGYDGSFSHQGIYALDFAMPEGTPITAARDGIVIEVIQQFNVACLDDSCKNRGNHVVIYQPDGSMATYGHIRYQGSIVNVGDTVKRGDLLAYSGNTGYSAGPHLHFSCSLPGVGQQPTIATKFIVHQGTPAGYLLKGELYKKEE